MVHVLEKRYGTITKAPEDDEELQALRTMVNRQPVKNYIPKISSYNIRLVKRAFDLYKERKLELSQISDLLGVKDNRVFYRMRRMYNFDGRRYLSTVEITKIAYQKKFKSCGNHTYTKNYINKINGEAIF
jgi:hypothetical protein